MSFFKGALLSVAFATLITATASAQIAGRPWELSGSAGTFVPDQRARMQTSPATQGALGWRLGPAFLLEARGTFGPSHADTTRNQKHNFSQIGIDLRWDLRPAENHTVPFFSAGFGRGLSHTSGSLPDKLERGAPTFALGLLQALGGQRRYLRFEVRDVMFRERQAPNFSNHLFATIGLQFVLGGKPHDSDLDGVRDWLDQCPSTPFGAKVDAHGCPIDSDGDGVFDGLDKCANTPKGCTIDKNGCPKDEDGDGVCDGLDQCPNTPKGATVDAHGCPHDGDGDGIYDGLDHCPDTPKGCPVDSVGCSHDSDGDGICDGLDHCDHTPAGLKVDDHGCPIEVSEYETQLLDTGSIRLRNIEFETNKATLKAESDSILDEVGRVLIQFPQLIIEIGGHTDSRGGAPHNQKLSEARASAVLTYLVQKYPQIQAKQFTARGYGMTVPLAPNTTELGRAKNRRVEFRVQNPEALKIEREKRRYLKQGESVPPAAQPQAAPADTTRK